MGKFSFSKLLNQGSSGDHQDYKAHREKSSVLGEGDGSQDATRSTNMIAAQRQANRKWGRDKQPQGDDK